MLPEIITSIPGPRSLELAETLGRYESQNVTYRSSEFPVFWERAEGVNVWDADGNRFLDFTSAFAVCGLGHAAPKVREALMDQAGRLIHGMGDVHPSPRKAELCEVLSRITFERWDMGRGKTILCNSGSEAVESALKTALLYGGKAGVICFTGAYHGLGMGALETSGIPYFREPFRAQLAKFATHLPFPNCDRCPYGCEEGFRLEGRQFPNCCTTCLEKLRAEIEGTIKHHEIGCILVEPIQGRGGDIVPPRDFLTMLREICSEHKILLILDEIYTGFNRTGRLFACDHFEVVPDIICLGKGLTSGFPFGACVGRADIMDAWPPSPGEALHTSTFLGNPLGCAMALASIEEHLKPETQQAARESGKLLRQGLENLKSPHVRAVRGLGAMLGVELVKTNDEPFGALAGRILESALKDGLLLLAGGPSGNVLTFAPPFAINAGEIDYLCGRLQEYLTSLPGSIS